VTTNGSNCAWTASSGATWATIAPSSGTGNGTVGVTASSNAGSVASRLTNVTIAGQSVNVTQSGTTCAYGLQSANGTVPASGGTGSVGVVAPGVCGWTSVSNSPSWLTISSSSSGGSGDVVFVAAPNPNASPQVGTLTIAGQTYTVTQAGASCSFSLGAANTTVASAGLNNGSLPFSTTSSGCSPSAVSYASWLTVSTAFAGSSGSVTYSVAPNPSGTTRVGTVQIGDQTFTVSQIGAACAFSLNAYGAVFNDLGVLISPVGASQTVAGSPSALGCSPAYGTNQPSIITMLGPLSGPVLNIFSLPYGVSVFSSTTTAVRLATITFGGQIFTVKQTSW
jgi:hypothetical protein